VEDVLAEVLAPCCELTFAVDTCVLLELGAEIAFALERALVEYDRSDVFEVLTMEDFVCDGSDAAGILAVEPMFDDKDVLTAEIADSDESCSTELLTIGVDCGIRTRLVLMIVTALELGAGS
jgi:hypothetical protein